MSIKNPKDNKDEKLVHPNIYRYPGQFFNVGIIDLKIKDNQAPKDLHEQEWQVIYFGHDMAPTLLPNKSIDYSKLPLERELMFYLLKPGNTKKDFLDHVQYMLDQPNEEIIDSVKFLIQGWVDYHFDLINTPNKEWFFETQKPFLSVLPDNQTKAFFIHFHVQMGNIQKDREIETLKYIEKPKYIEYGDKQSYDEYLNIRKENGVSARRMKECCQAILKIKEIDSAIKAQAKNILTGITG